jgi:hypothetical protein
MEFIEAIQPYAGQPITKQILLHLLKDYKRPIDKIHELVKAGKLESLKRGFFIPGKKLNISAPEPFLIAHHLYGPSYVSFDSALAYWGMIPEKVSEFHSATIAHYKIFRTPSGRFTYTHLPLPWYSYGIQQVTLAINQNALVASQEKALCDKIISTPGLQLRSPKQTAILLIDNLRIEKQALKQINHHEIEKWVDYAPKKESMHILIKTLKAL